MLRSLRRLSRLKERPRAQRLPVGQCVDANRYLRRSSSATPHDAQDRFGTAVERTPRRPLMSITDP
eukprot:CAMPEP_0181220596 /NCGR_PEP_ID=MMETSP1096-20121128/28925_1 /TAXON_ID=156174 ORGANISM="Chrysochromulina ericina, Strain CCMP281" /NCGR_SAMPLE_ID=MMETSP1096 /ASSEMBLY_ACC=CAM_ASM_000453 /LENGTH=65 /DNA_ID=CAMNT_0023313117 /DNA_START=287 /DNA_END=481 /DNA_ORIENTATION=+